MINHRFAAGVALAGLLVGCASPAMPASSPAASAGPTPTGQPAPTVLSATPTSSVPPSGPVVFHEGSLLAGTYVMTPFVGPDRTGRCMTAAWGCTEDPADDSIRVTFTVPSGFEGRRAWLIWGPDADTGLAILRGGGLYNDPCHSSPPPDIAVGTTVEDFATALAAHPPLDATTPEDASLGGYSGKYVDLQLPADVAGCTDGQFYPWEPGLYAQGPSQRWHLWILDVDGVRVVVQAMDYARVSAARRAQLQAIVDSIEITP